MFAGTVDQFVFYRRTYGRNYMLGYETRGNGHLSAAVAPWAYQPQHCSREFPSVTNSGIVLDRRINFKREMWTKVRGVNNLGT